MPLFECPEKCAGFSEAQLHGDLIQGKTGIAQQLPGQVVAGVVQYRLGQANADFQLTIDRHDG